MRAPSSTVGAALPVSPTRQQVGSHWPAPPVPCESTGRVCWGPCTPGTGADSRTRLVGEARSGVAPPAIAPLPLSGRDSSVVRCRTAPTYTAGGIVSTLHPGFPVVPQKKNPHHQVFSRSPRKGFPFSLIVSAHALRSTKRPRVTRMRSRCSKCAQRARSRQPPRWRARSKRPHCVLGASRIFVRLQALGGAVLPPPT